MAEPFAVVSIVASIVQLADLTAKVVRRLNEFQSGIQDVPKSLSHLVKQLPILTETLGHIQKGLDNGLQGNESVLRPAIQGCHEQVSELDTILTKSIPSEKDGRGKRAWKAISSVWNDSKVDSITKIIQSYTGTLSFYYIALSSTLNPLQDDKLRKIRVWLSAPDPSTNYEKARKLYQPKTGKWFLESDQYTSWEKDPASFVWLYGMPGCGKTILSSTIIEDLLKNTEADPGQIVLYFYYDFNDRQKQEPEQMLRSLISQISTKCVQIPETLDVLFSSIQKGSPIPPVDTLMSILKQSVLVFPHVYIVFDALDECNKVTELVSLIEQIANWEIDGLHVLLTSRPEWEIKRSLETFILVHNIIPLEHLVVDKDIDMYIQQRLHDDKDLQKWCKNKDIQQMIVSKLTTGAQGMFRWAVCQLDMLGKCRNIKSLHKTVEDLPSTLDETYERILLSISPQDVDYVLRVLRWLLFSLEPLRLSLLAEIVALDPDRETAYDKDEVFQDPEEILDICSSLVTSTLVYSETDPQVTLSHFSVKEYLLSVRMEQSRVPLFSMRSSYGHRYLALCCLKYTLQCEPKGTRNRNSRFPISLETYAAYNWTSHFSAMGESDNYIDGLVIKLLQPLLPGILDKHFGKFSKNEHFAKDLRGRFYKFLSKNPELTYRLFALNYAGLSDETTQCALRFASYHDIISVARLLLNTGAHPNHGHSPRPIAIATRRGHLGLVKEFVSRGVSVHDELHDNIDNRGTDEAFTLLQIAAMQSSIESVRFLLSAGAQLNKIEGTFETALAVGILSHDLEMVKYLVQSGAAVNTPLEQQGSALHVASRLGSLQLVDFLIQCGADIHIEGGVYGSVLQAASARKSARFGRDSWYPSLLLELGGTTKILEATFPPMEIAGYLVPEKEEKRLATIAYLIKNGARIDAQGGHFGSPLSAAAAWNFIPAVKLLFAHCTLTGMDKISHYGHALRWAIRRRRKETTQFFLDQGVDLPSIPTDFNLFGTQIYSLCPSRELFVELLDPHYLRLNKPRLPQVSETRPPKLKKPQLSGVKELTPRRKKYRLPLSPFFEAVDDDRFGSYPLEKTGLLRMLESRDYNVNAPGDYSTSPLQNAASQTQKAPVLLTLLSSKNIQIHHSDAFGDTALSVAIQRGLTRNIEALLDHGAATSLEGTSIHIPITDTYGECFDTEKIVDSVVHSIYKAWALERAITTTRELCDAGALVKSSHKHHEADSIRRFLMKKGVCFTSDSIFWEACSYGDLEIMEELLESHGDVNAPGPRYKAGSPLQAALYMEDEDMALLLLKRGASIGADLGSHSSIYFASACGFAGVVRQLLDQGALVDGSRIPSPYPGDTESEIKGDRVKREETGDELYENIPLHIAAKNDNLEVVQLLLERGASIDARCSASRTALQWAAACGHTSILALLLDRGADTRLDRGTEIPIYLAAAEGCLDTVQFLHQRFGDIETETPNGMVNALYHAFWRRNYATTMWLLEQGSKPDHGANWTKLVERAVEEEVWDPRFAELSNRLLRSGAVKGAEDTSAGAVELTLQELAL